MIDNTRKELFRRYHAITHRIGQYYNSTYEQAVLVAQMNAHEVAMLEGELKEIKIKMSLMGIPEPVMKNTYDLAAERLRNVKST